MSGDATGTAEIKAVPVRHPGRWLGALVVVVLVAMLINSFFTNPQYKWGQQWKYFVTKPILHGLSITLEVTVAAMAIGIAGGILLAIMRLSPNPVISSVSWFYIWLFRGTPVLVQIVMWFNLAFLFPKLSIGIPFGPTFVTEGTNQLISPLTAGILALGLNEAAYMAEIVRAGILSVDEGQSEAASALGMTRTLVMRRIVLPQAMRVIVPPTGNETISMLKTTSLLIFIAVPELFQQGQNIINRTFLTIPILIMVSIWYLLVTSILTVGQFYVERYYGRGSSRTQPKQTLPRQLWQALRYTRPSSSMEEQELIDIQRHGQ
jgi:polar amino acid transport system permease protein